MFLLFTFPFLFFSLDPYFSFSPSGHFPAHMYTNKLVVSIEDHNSTFFLLQLNIFILPSLLNIDDKNSYTKHHTVLMIKVNDNFVLELQEVGSGCQEHSGFQSVQEQNHHEENYQTSLCQGSHLQVYTVCPRSPRSLNVLYKIAQDLALKR